MFVGAALQCRGVRVDQRAARSVVRTSTLLDNSSFRGRPVRQLNNDLSLGHRSWWNVPEDRSLECDGSVRTRRAMHLIFATRRGRLMNASSLQRDI
jgi:hypothetical protein